MELCVNDRITAAPSADGIGRVPDAVPFPVSASDQAPQAGGPRASDG